MTTAATAQVSNTEVAEATEAATGSSVRIRPDLTSYVSTKSASGSSTKICGDDISVVLAGATLDETYVFVADVVSVAELDLRAKYQNSNPGQQRMFLGNLVRGAIKGKDQEKAKRVSEAFEAKKADFRAKIDARLAEAAKVKETEAKQKAEQKLKEKEEAAAKKAEAKKTAPSAEKKPSAPKEPSQPKVGK